MELEGIVASGEGNASYWLTRFASVYQNWLGMPIYPGSLNLRLAHPFYWNQPNIEAHRKTFSLFPHGGERLIYILPCKIVRPGQCPAFLWSTTNGAAEPRPIVEIIGGTRLRDQFKLVDGSPMTVVYPRLWTPPHPTAESPAVG